MILTLHGIATYYSNIKTDIRLAREAGYDGYELLETKLLRFLDQGFETKDLLPLFNKYRIQPDERKLLLIEAERLCQAAENLKVPTLQLVPFNRLKGRPWAEVLELTARNVADIADIGKEHAMDLKQALVI